MPGAGGLVGDLVVELQRPVYIRAVACFDLIHSVCSNKTDQKPLESFNSIRVILPQICRQFNPN